MEDKTVVVEDKTVVMDDRTVVFDRDDVTEVTAGEVEGVKNRVDNAAKDFKRNLVGIFTIGQK